MEDSLNTGESWLSACESADGVVNAVGERV